MNKKYQKVEGQNDPEKDEKDREGRLFSGLCMLFPPKEVRREVKSHLLRSEVELVKAFRSVLDAGIEYLEKRERNLQKEANKIKKIDIE